MKVRTRFAPSPTGYLHLGGLRTALYTYLIKKKNNGKFVLRIEDTDQEREVEGAVGLIYKSMALAGLTYDEGPDVGGSYGPYIQSQRQETYLPYAKQLVESGHGYYCFCTKAQLDERRAKVEADGGTFKYDKHCLHLSKEEVAEKLAQGLPYVIRQNIPTRGTAFFDDLLFGHIETDMSILDDNVLIKADGFPTYNFANVVDDHLMEISHVTRGVEYLSSTPKYNLLYQALGWEPPKYIHLPVVMRDSSRKLSKRYGDPSFEDLLAQGFVKEAIINFIALLGWSPGDDREFFTLEELVEAFDIKGLSKSPAIFNMDKLVWFNGEYIRKMPFEEYLQMVTPWFDQVFKGQKEMDYHRLAELMQARTEVFNRVPEMVAFLVTMPDYDLDLYNHKKMKTNPQLAKEALEMMLPVLENVADEDWTEAKLHDVTITAISQSGKKNGAVLWPLRIAISGQANTPGGAFEIAYLLGKGETLERMEKSMAKIENEG